MPTKYIPCSVIENFDIAPIMHGMLAELNDIQEKILMQVLAQCLGRPAVNDDAKRMTLYYQSEDVSLEGLNSYDVAFDDVKIGRMVLKNDGSKYGGVYTVTFHPENPI